MTALLTTILAIAVGVIVLPLYAAQPLLASIGPSLGISSDNIGIVATMPMLGYATGLVFLVPLTDLVEVRRLVLLTLGVGIAALIAVAASPSAPIFLAAAFVVGITATATQMLIPLAAGLAAEAVRGRTIGRLMSGLMIGVLLSRPEASLAADAFGWRGAFLLNAAGLSIVLLALCLLLPTKAPSTRSSYAVLLRSLWTTLLQEPVLRRRALYQAMCMGAFGCFWTVIALRLEGPPFGFGPVGIAAFALAGIGGAVIAPVAGWAGDRGLTQAATRLAHALAVIGSILAGVAGADWFGLAFFARPLPSLALLISSAVILDMGVIADQALGRRSINLLRPELRGRLNGLYTGLFFLGGGLGSVIAGVAWAHGGWSLVCLAATSFACAALVLEIVLDNVRAPRSSPALSPRPTP